MSLNKFRNVKYFGKTQKNGIDPRRVNSFPSHIHCISSPWSLSRRIARSSARPARINLQFISRYQNRAWLDTTPDWLVPTFLKFWTRRMQNRVELVWWSIQVHRTERVAPEPGSWAGWGAATGLSRETRNADYNNFSWQMLTRWLWLTGGAWKWHRPGPSSIFCCLGPPKNFSVWSYFTPFSGSIRAWKNSQRNEGKTWKNRPKVDNRWLLPLHWRRPLLPA